MCGLHVSCFAGAYIYLHFQLIKALFTCGRSISLQAQCVPTFRCARYHVSQIKTWSNKERISKDTFTTTQQFFLIRTRPQRVSHPHRPVFSSAPVCTFAQVEKHYSTSLHQAKTQNIILLSVTNVSRDISSTQIHLISNEQRRFCFNQNT